MHSPEWFTALVVLDRRSLYLPLSLTPYLLVSVVSEGKEAVIVRVELGVVIGEIPNDFSWFIVWVESRHCLVTRSSDTKNRPARIERYAVIEARPRGKPKGRPSFFEV